LFYHAGDLPASTATTQDNLSWVFSAGENVRVESDVSIAIQRQEEMIGWNEGLKNVINLLIYTYGAIT
jgi:hypothetical protein